MSQGGWATAGASGLGPSSAYDALPFQNYKSVATWIEDFVDAIGLEFDIRDQMFIGSGRNGATPARASLLDPNTAPTAAMDNFATATTPPNLCPVKDTMLDVLLFISGIPWPVDTSLTVAQKQALVKVGWTALRRKGTRRQLLNLIAQVVDGVVYGWTTPPYSFSFIVPEGFPSPGFGSWVQTAATAIGHGTATFTQNSTAVTGASTKFTQDFRIGGRISSDAATWYRVSAIASDTALTIASNFTAATVSTATYYGNATALYRPNQFGMIRTLVSRIFPDFNQLGVGYSAFRIGYSAFGEPLLPVGARLNLLQNEHFQSGVTNTWNTTSGTLTESTGDGFINTEFTSDCAVMDQTAAAYSAQIYTQQALANINNQVTHRFEMDYCYGNPYTASTLLLTITDPSPPTFSDYWNPTTKTWSSASYTIPVPACPFATLTGTITTSDGTATITGQGTLFLSQLIVGQQITVDKSTFYYVKSIASNTSLTLTANFVGTKTTVAAYSIARQRFGFDIIPQRRDAGYALTGTVSTTSGSTSVTGVGTLFKSQIGLVGSPVFSVDQNKWYGISSVGSDTNLTLASNALATSSAVTGYVSYYTGQQKITIAISTTSDGTATTKQRYTIYRAGLYEKFDVAIDAQSQGERTLWLPLKDAGGWVTASRAAAGATVVEPANADRSAYTTVAATAVSYPYHAALSNRGYLATSAWANVILGSNDFITDWTLSNATSTANSVISPVVGETTATATQLTATTTAASLSQTTGQTPTNKTYCGGIWAQKTSADVSQAGTATFTAGSTTVTGSGTAFRADGSWNNIQIKTAGGNVWTVSSVGSATSLTLSTAPTITETAVTFSVSDIAILAVSTSTKAFPFFLKQSQGWQLLPFSAAFGGGDVALLTFRIAWGMTSGSTTIGVASSYLYNVTSSPSVLYPPVCQTPVGSIGIVKPTTSNSVTASQGVNVLHPLLQRALASVARGVLTLSVVPTFDGSSQLAGVVFDVGQGAAQNRVVVRVRNSALELFRWDNAGNTTSASITLSNNAFPTTAGTMTWQRDTAIVVRCVWDTTGTSITAGNGSAYTAIPNTWSSVDTSVANVTIGNDIAGANQFDGMVSLLEVIQSGAPIN